MSKLWYAIIAQMLGSVIAFYQLQGWVIWPEKPWLKSLWWIYLTSLLIAPLFYQATKLSYEHFGTFWNMRLAGFGIGTIVFGIMAWWLIGEIPTLKTIISILLAVSIILIQVTNVVKI